MIDRIASRINNEELNKFAHLTSNDERVAFIINKGLLRSEKWLPLYFGSCQNWQGKSSEVAQLWKTKGNKLFQQNKFVEALDLYTLSLLSAPQGANCPDYALSLGNRSAALYHLGHYSECIKDIHRALNTGFPSVSKHKLLVRDVWACVKMKQLKPARKALKKLEHFLESFDCPLNQLKKDDVSKEVETLTKQIASLNDSSPKKETSPPSPPQVFHGNNNNPVLSQATDAITVTVTPEQGRFIVANQALDKGSTLVVERPYAAVLLPDHYDTHCHHCCKSLPLNPIGCVNCAEVRFCTEVCGEVAWKSYHKLECPYLRLMHSIGVAHLSLRIVLTAKLDYLQEFLSNPWSKRHEDIYIKGVGLSGKYDCSYLPVYDLVTHEVTTETHDLLQYSLTAALLLLTLTSAGWLDNLAGVKTWKNNLCVSVANDAEIPSEILPIGGLLLRHILQLVCNAHAITSILPQPDILSSISPDPRGDAPSPVTTVQQVRVATAIYPTVSLMNHSCDPTIQASFIGDVLVVRTLKAVKKGEEIFNCYGPHHCRMATSERQEVLKAQYHFTCQCEACLSQDVSSHRFRAFKCPQCAGIMRDNVCTECGEEVKQSVLEKYTRQANKMDELFTKGNGYMKAGICTEALDALFRCAEGRRSVLYREHKDLAVVEDALAQCLAHLGEYSAAADHLISSVSFVHAMYGPHSTEAAHEGLKLAEVLYNADRFTECLQACTDALVVFENVYTPKHDAVCQTRALRDNALRALTPIMKNT